MIAPSGPGRLSGSLKLPCTAESGSTTKFQDVLIKDNAFRIGDSKFTVTRQGTAQIKTIMTNSATGASSLETAYAKQG